jgi:site-specific DNA-methyltransferase (adenine-specific)
VSDIWVSFFLDGILTIRDTDWDELAQGYIIPEPIEEIDRTAIMPKNNRPMCSAPKKAEPLDELLLFADK